MKTYKSLGIIYNITYEKRTNRNLDVDHKLWDLIEENTWETFIIESRYKEEKTNLSACIRKLIRK